MTTRKRSTRARATRPVPQPRNPDTLPILIRLRADQVAALRASGVKLTHAIRSAVDLWLSVGGPVSAESQPARKPYTYTRAIGKPYPHTQEPKQ